jgi:calcineurin-like phosphoesterase family protein
VEFFIGDTHFGHQNILKFEPELRPFNTVEDMNEALVENWNRVVGDDDVVFHLGDVAFASQYQYLSRLKGRKIVIVLGNHDYCTKVPEILAQSPKIRVCGAMEFRGCLLTHIPVHPAQLTHRYKCNIHGHMHSKKLEDPRYINVSAEQVCLTPVSWDVLKHFVKFASGVQQ